MIYTEEDGMLKAKNYRFFERSAHIAGGAANCHPTYYKELLKCACEKVWIWDPYFKDDDENVFDVIPSDVDVRVLYIWNTDLRMRIVPPTTAFARIVGQLSAHTGNIEVGYIKSGHPLYNQRKWHDRFLIIDRSTVFLVGGSLTSQRYDAKSFGIYELSDADEAGLVLERFEDTWNAVVAAGFLIH